MRGRVEIVREAMEKIDRECMQEDIDLEAVVVLSSVAAQGYGGAARGGILVGLVQSTTLGQHFS